MTEGGKISGFKIESLDFPSKVAPGEYFELGVDVDFQGRSGETYPGKILVQVAGKTRSDYRRTKEVKAKGGGEKPANISFTLKVPNRLGNFEIVAKALREHPNSKQAPTVDSRVKTGIKTKPAHTLRGGKFF